MVDADAENRKPEWRTIALLVIAIAVIVAGIQGLLFFSAFSPRITEAKAQLFDLMVEKSQGRLLQSVNTRLDTITKEATADDEAATRLAAARDVFGDQFTASPRDAIEALQASFEPYAAAAKNPGEGIASLGSALGRLQQVYSDPYSDLQADLEQPPFYLWPTANYLARKSGYWRAAVFNHALYLTQTGEIGTARVMLTGLHAALDDAQMIGLVYYTLGRLEFEVFRDRPEADYYTQTVKYLRQSLQADPDSQLATRFYDYLLSLSQGTSVPRSGKGKPTTPSEGEGAAISEDERVF